MLRIRDVYLGSRILIFVHTGSRIQKQNKRERGEKNLLSYLLSSHKYHKIENYFIFELMKKYFWSIYKEL